MEIISRADAKAQGLKHYFTGEPCRNGHVAQRYVDSYACMKCVSDRAAEKQKNETPEQRAKRLAKLKKHREDDPEAQRERMKRWRAENQEYVKEWQATYSEENRDRRNAGSRAYYAEHKEEAAVRARRYYRDNKERMAETARAWKQAHPEAVKAIKGNYRARQKAAEGFYTAEDIQRIDKLQRGRCAGCRCKLGKICHIDHIIPLSKGGTNWPRNLQLLCGSCNNQKYNKDPIEWNRENGRLL